MTEQVMEFDASKPLTRAAMIVMVALALIGSWFVVRWYLGNTVAENLNPDQSGLEMARLAVSWAPNDPLAHWRLGDLVQKKLPRDQQAQAINEYEKAVGLSPNDYRFWMTLGSALEQSGEVKRAEKALRQATKLAPAYSYPRWYLGNLLLRTGRYEESFSELQRASEADPELRAPVFNLAWEVYNKDLGAMTRSVGTSAEARAQFSLYLLGRERFEEGIVVWKSLNETEKQANRESGQAMIASLVTAKRFHEAADVSNDLALLGAYQAAEGKFLNSGFEEDLPRQSASVFGWQVKSLQQAQIGIDSSQGYNSRRSLRIVFQVPSRLELVNVSQLIPVARATQYDFQCYVKTHGLQSLTTPIVEIVDAMDGSVIATSQPAADGNSDWQRISMNFKTGPKTEAVTVRINRASCGEEPVCPIFGTVWYDNFNLQRRG
jgi:tetratricopeptide (TPR) repeat protein